ncbi:ketopantoate reductase PanE/ApbA-domain-containing protein [Phascolomyces articulosus]|uniref:Ketopantoate reductase PanE/ApbA-domain-containing protein n=1 Tax=Phascolomyces articulosus TaxID=60185 RepID=A0AAD5KKT4_9FUNG|nr:ketopantoate reductase PanE/ApbA-domain-containing protein [Phascolomyces articulosus]
MVRLSTLRSHSVMYNHNIITANNIPRSRMYRNLTSSALKSPSFLSHNNHNKIQPLFLSRFRSYTTESMAPPAPRILTVGTGAIGSIYSWRLSKYAHVTTVCRSNYDAVRRDGLKIESKKFGEEIFVPNEVVKSVPEEPFDYVMVTMKALPDVYSVADIIAPAVTKGKTTIVLIQNGLGVEDPIVERFPDNPIVSIVAYIGTSQIAPGHIKMVGDESLIVGNYLSSPVNADPQIDSFVDLLNKGGCTVNRVNDIDQVRWQKLFWNGTFSAVCTVARMNTTEVLNCPEAMTTVKKLMREFIESANAMGYEYNAEEQIEIMLERTRVTAMDYKPSMLLDFERGQPMEISVILGTPLRRAKAKGMKVPNLEMMHDILVSIQKTIKQFPERFRIQ